MSNEPAVEFAATGDGHGEPLPSPRELSEQLPLTRDLALSVRQGRHDVVRVLAGADPRFLAIVGPCSVHDTDGAVRYAAQLAALADELRDHLVIVMRTYVEKPRTTVGWQGLATDPGLDGGHDVARGLRSARQTMRRIAALGLPMACEWLNPMIAGYLADLASWGAVGARTVESQPHRQLASGLPMPIGMKNRTDGDIQVAVDAVQVAAMPHVYPGMGHSGHPVVVRTGGNADCHVVLRGGATGPNHHPTDVADTAHRLRAAGLPERVVVDASHGNSGKDPCRQLTVVREIAAQVAAGSRIVRGVMLESYLTAGRQDLVPGQPPEPDRSITDACLGWADTATLLRELADAAAHRAGTGADAAARPPALAPVSIVD